MLAWASRNRLTQPSYCFRSHFPNEGKGNHGRYCSSYRWLSLACRRDRNDQRRKYLRDRIKIQIDALLPIVDDLKKTNDSVQLGPGSRSSGVGKYAELMAMTHRSIVLQIPAKEASSGTEKPAETTLLWPINCVCWQRLA